MPSAPQQNMVWIDQPHNVDPELLGAAMLQYKFKNACVLIQEGSERLRQEDLKDLNWWDRLQKAAGGKVIRWGWVNDSHGERGGFIAKLAHEQVADYKLQAVMFDFEATWETNKEQGYPGKALDFCTEWRRFRPGILTGLSSYACPQFAALEWSVFAHYKFRYFPQNLYKYAGYYEPFYSVRYARPYGIPLSYVHFMLSREESHDIATGITLARSGAKWAFDNYKVKVLGLGLYLGENDANDGFSGMREISNATDLYVYV